MRVLVLYDTVSASKMTGQVAETITKTLKENGVNVDSFYVKDADVASMKNYDCLIAGAPTMAFSPSTEIMKFLNGLAGFCKVVGKIFPCKLSVDSITTTICRR
jgi:menaquinone-dependent protoporphyrinogen IX oxidase